MANKDVYIYLPDSIIQRTKEYSITVSARARYLPDSIIQRTKEYSISQGQVLA